MQESNRAPIASFPAVDVHAHYGIYNRGVSKLVDEFMTGDAETVAARARESNTVWTIVSPLLALLPRFHGDAVAGNEEAARVASETGGLLQWVVINPLQPESYAQAERMLALPKCVGIKIHPEEHGYPIVKHGTALFEFAAKHRAVVLTHSGEQNSLPADFVPFANEFPEVNVILAHLGHGWDGDPSHQVRAIQAGKRDNLYVDTSSSNSIMPGLIEWAVREVGASRLLYGTDTPLYFAAMQRARIDHAKIRDDEKQQILSGNATKLLNLDRFHSERN
jgi:predicted TIM-barrel fold metal-dependent hydrolase